MGSTSSADRSSGAAARRTGRLPLAVTAVVVPTVLAGLTLLWPGRQIEDDLTRSADASLAAAGVTGAQVVLDGRDARVDGPPGAVEIVQGVTGVRIARAAGGGATGPGGGDLQGAAAAALAGLAGTGLAATVDGDTVTLTGTVGDDAASAAAESALAAALPGLTVDNRLDVTRADPGADPGTGELDDAATQQLAAALEELVAGAPITFEPDSPALTAAGSATVARVVELVGAAPGARLQVDGFVAAGPGDGRLTAQQLSDQRAATVGDALVAGGVPADRVAVRGLGEGRQPVPDVAGRRVEITVV